MKTAQVLIQSYTDREKIITALAQNGYRVKVIEKDDPKKYLGKLYYVEFEVNDITVTE